MTQNFDRKSKVIDVNISKQILISYRTCTLPKNAIYSLILYKMRIQIVEVIYLKSKGTMVINLNSIIVDRGQVVFHLHKLLSINIYKVV